MDLFLFLFVLDKQTGHTHTLSLLVLQPPSPPAHIEVGSRLWLTAKSLANSVVLRIIQL
jgi:hypothetical protein